MLKDAGLDPPDAADDQQVDIRKDRIQRFIYGHHIPVWVELQQVWTYPE